MSRRKRIYIFLIFILFISVMHAHAQDKGGRWRFNHDGLDTADWDSEDDTGVLQGAASYQSFIPLQEGSSFLFLDSTDVNDFFRVEDSPDLDFTDENIGISMWIYSTKVGDDVHYLLNKGDQYTIPKTTNYALRLSKTGKLEFLIRDVNNQAQSVSSTFDISEDQWTFVAVFFDFASGKVHFWNEPHSDAIDTLDFNYSYFSNDDPLAIGSWYTSDPAKTSVKDFEGRIDDVRIGTKIQHILNGDTNAATSPVFEHPCHFHLMPNYPNPFNADTMISFDMSRSAYVSLRIYDTGGRLIATLNEGRLSPGRHFVPFHAHALATGIYYVELCSDSFREIQKIMLMR